MTNDGGSLGASLYMLDQKLKNSSGRIMIFLVLELCLSQRPKITKKVVLARYLLRTIKNHVQSIQKFVTCHVNSLKVFDKRNCFHENIRIFILNQKEIKGCLTGNGHIKFISCLIAVQNMHGCGNKHFL